MVIKDSSKNFVVEPKELLDKINSKKKIRIIDARWYLSEKKKGLTEYKRYHLEGAIFFDIDEISNKSSSLPHMLPTKEEFSEFAENNDLKRNSEIVIYDQVGFFSSSRVWLTFKHFGFKNIKILNGGIKNWKKQKFPLTKSIKEFKKTKFKCPNILSKKIINKTQIEEVLKNNKYYRIVDARPKERFLGIFKEPRPNLRKGNIPSSLNIPFDMISKNGFLKSVKELKKIISQDNNLKIKDNIICYCGSGITACNIIFTLNILGYKKVKLYDGSWAEWGKKK